MTRLLAAAVCALLATAAFASPDDAPPRVELPLGPYVRAGRPLDVRVIGGADRVRAPGTPWALPLGDRGEEFLLQMPAAVSVPLDLTVERDGRTDRITVTATVLPTDGIVIALLGEAAAPAGATGVRVPAADHPTVLDAWLLYDEVVSDSRDLRPWWMDVGPFRRPFDPLVLGPDAYLFAATEEAAAASPLLDRGDSTVLVLLAATLAVLSFVLAFRRDRPWVRAAWLGAPAIAVALVVAAGGTTAPLVAVPLAVEGVRSVVYVRVHALRDGSGTLHLPARANVPAALIRYSAEDGSVEQASAGREVRLSLRAGESRVFGYVCRREEGSEPPEVTAPAGRAAAQWLASHRLMAAGASGGVGPDKRPLSADVRVLPGVEVVLDDLPTK